MRKYSLDDLRLKETQELSNCFLDRIYALQLRRTMLIWFSSDDNPFIFLIFYLRSNYPLKTSRSTVYSSPFAIF